MRISIKNFHTHNFRVHLNPLCFILRTTDFCYTFISVISLVLIKFLYQLLDINYYLGIYYICERIQIIDVNNFITVMIPNFVLICTMNLWQKVKK